MRAYTLKKIPQDVHKIVIEEQARIKKETGRNQISFEYVVHKMLRDYQKCREENQNFKP